MFKLIYSIIVVLISIGFVILLYILRKKHLDRQIEVKNYKENPPEGYNAAEIAFLYNDIVKNEYMNSILLSLADRGYIDVEETGMQDSQTNLSNYRINKLREYDGQDQNEGMYLKELFQYGLNRNSVLSSDLFGKIGTTTEEIKKNLSNKYKKEIYQSGMPGVARLSIIMTIIIVLLAFIIPLVVPTNIMYLISGIIGAICIGALVYIGKDIKVRTESGNKILEEIEAFKRFIETGDNDQITSVLEENRNYFYDVLPYTFAIGDTDKFFEKMNAIDIKKPEWFQTKKEFNMQDLKKFVDLLKILE